MIKYFFIQFIYIYIYIMKKEFRILTNLIIELNYKYLINEDRKINLIKNNKL